MCRIAVPIILFAPFFFSTNSFSQEISQSLEYKSDSLIVYLPEQRNLNADIVEFTTNINRTLFDSLNNDVTIEFRANRKKDVYIKTKGSVAKYDFDSKELLWEREVNFLKAFVNYSHNVVVEIGPDISTGRNLETGRVIWAVSSNLMPFNLNKDVVIGYDYKTKSRLKILRGYDVLTGDKLWSAQVDRRYGWRGWSKLDDDNFVIGASGLSCINHKKGLNWSHETKLVKRDSKPYPQPGIAFNQNSNVLIDQEEIYYATSSSIHRLNRDGEFLWNTPIDNKETGTSFLLEHSDSTLLFVSTGFANHRGKPFTVYGKKYMLLIDREDGDIIWKQKVKNPLKIKAAWIDEHIYLTNRKMIAAHDVISGGHVGDVKMKNELTALKGGLEKSDSIFIYRNATSSFDFLSNDKPDHLWLLAKDFEVFNIDSDGNKVHHITPKDFFQVSIDRPDFKILSSLSKSYVVRPDLTAVIEIKGSQPHFFRDEVYFVHDNVLLKIPLNTILEAL